MEPLISEGRGALDDGAPSPTLIERLATSAAMIGIGLLCLVVTITVVLRWFSLPSIPDAVLIVRELMVFVIIMPLAYVTATRSHIEVTVFSDWLGRRARLLLSIFGHAIGLIFALAMIWAATRLFADLWVSGGYYDGDIYLPKWIGYAAFVLGICAFALRLGVTVVLDCMTLLQRRR